MASLEPSESGTFRLYPKVPPKQQSGYSGRVWSKDQQNPSVLCFPPKGKIHTGEYFSLLRIRLNSNFLQLEAKRKREALKHCQLWCYLITLIQEPASHLPRNSSSNKRKPKYRLPFLHPVLVICIHFSAWVINIFHKGIYSFGSMESFWEGISAKSTFLIQFSVHCWWSLPLLMALQSMTIFSQCIHTLTYQTIKWFCDGNNIQSHPHGHYTLALNCKPWAVNVVTFFA